jgi:hypothetical protein
MGKRIDLTGQRFGRWTVIEEAGKTEQGQGLWKCLCDCGTNGIIRGAELRRGHTHSCGCLQIKHRMSQSPVYKSWSGMFHRSTNPKHPAYKNYGGREIGIEDGRWLEFKNFYEDMGERPKETTLERQDNERGYCKENCYWASRIVQNRNQRVRKDNKTGVKGVNFCKYWQKYVARISVNKKRINLGSFANLQDAINARNQAEKKYWRSECVSL